MPFNIQNFGYITCLITSFLLSAIVYLRAKHYVGKLFALFLFLLFLWVLCSMLTDNNQIYQQRLFWTKMCMVGPILAAPIFWVFAKNFPNHSSLLNKKELIIALLTTLPLLALVPTKLNVTSIESLGYGAVFKPGPLYLIFLIYMSIFLVLSLIELSKRYKYSKQLERRQIFILSIGILTMTVISSIISLILPYFSYVKYHFVSPLSTLAITGATYYAISNHKLFGIKLVIGKAVYLILFVGAAYLLFYSYYLIQEKFLGDTYRAVALVVGFIIFVLFTFILFNINSRLKRTINYYIINRNYDPEKEIDQLTNALSQSLTYQQAISQTTQTIQNTIRPKITNIYLAKRQKTKPNKLFDKIAKALKENEYKEPILEDDITDSSPRNLHEIKHALSSSEIRAVFPVTIRNSLLGLLFLGEPKNSSSYTTEELRFITSICLVFAVAIDRVALMQKAKQVAVMKAKQDKEREIIDIMGHELRTPATVAKMAVEHLLTEAKSGAVSTKEIQNTLQYALSGIDHQYQLAQRYVTAARLAKGAFRLNKSKVDLLEIAAKTKKQFTFAAKEKNIEIKVTKNKQKIPPVIADPQAIHQVFSNLIENAIKYSDKGTVTILLDADSKNVSVSVSDQGPGIPKSEIPCLGKKFYRVKGRQKLSVQGTGLGLYVVFGTVRAHGGSVKIQSRVGEGTNFSFTLPR